MHSTNGWRLASALFLCGGLFATNQFTGGNSSIARAAGTATPAHLTLTGTTTFPVGGISVNQTPGLAPSGTDSESDGNPTFPINVDRVLGVSKGQGRVGVGASRAKSNPSVTQTFDGLNNYQEAYAQPGGNFIFEPPDQALCAGNGYVIDGVNDAMSIYNQSTGARVAGPTTLNGFYGLPKQYDSSTGAYGPEPTDPVCYYDADTGRFFFAMLNLEVAPSGLWYGGNEIDIAVSNTSNPTGAWRVWHMEVSGDGASGCPCLGDYPHIGADANGLYITTNDFPLVTDGFNGAQVYAFSKKALEGTAVTVDGWNFDTSSPGLTVGGDSGYTVWPATSPSGYYATSAKGTEYFLSSTFDNCAACTTSDNRIAVWALTNTSNLSGPNPPSLTNTTVTIAPYADPPALVAQKASTNVPFGEAYYGATTSQPIAANDSRNLTTVFANGKLWGALNTSVSVNGHNEAGIAYYIITPLVSPKGVLSATLALQGTLAADNANLLFPTIGVTPSGRGVMAYTLTGPNDFPSAAYSSLDAKSGAGPINTVAAGVGPSDGFSEYQPYYSNGDPRPRWGDYGAAAVDGDNVWVASEYIGQTCTLAQWGATAGHTCGQTRTYAANWATHITELNLHQ